MQEVFTVIVDFDHTLFDTDAFLRAAQSIAKRHGVSKTDFDHTFAAITDGRQDAAYNFTNHIRAFSISRMINERLLMVDLSKLLVESSRFLYPDSISFLKKLQKWNVHIHLVTFADAKMRKLQLESSGLKKLIDSIHIISTSRDQKIDRIKQICSSSFKSAIIDDHPRILEPLNGQSMLAIRIRRKRYRRFLSTEPLLPSVPVFVNLNDIYSFLEPILRTFGPKPRENVKGRYLWKFD